MLPPVAGDRGSVALADGDLDGDLDVFRGGQDALALALNDGSGSFTDASQRLPVFGTAGLPQQVSVTPADLDDDGDVDLFVGAFATPRLIINRHRHIDAGVAAIGQPWTVDVWSQPGYATTPRVCALAIGAARLAQQVQFGSLGSLWLDPSAPIIIETALIPVTTGKQPFAFAIPPMASLVGVELHAQAAIEETLGVGDVRLTTYDSVVVQ